MRLLLGMILGSLLTVVGAYVADQRAATQPVAGPEPPRSMVNWDVVGQKVNDLTAEAQTIWNDFTRQMTGPP